MSDQRYQQEIDALCERFRRELKGHDCIYFSPASRKIGIDALPRSLREMTKRAFNDRLRDGYELSYNQVCQAFFRAADQSGLWL